MTEIPLTLSEEVEAALVSGIPVLGLESNVIAHGLPSPDNMELVTECERQIRNRGVVPAITYLDRGQLHVGATTDAVSRLAEGGASKVTSREIATTLQRKALGATSVGATIRLCAAAGVKIVASAGLGGVHRDFTTSMDMSGDLYELARSPVAVVSAGVKKFLDIPRTCEVLESLNVPVIGYDTRTFPGFYCRDGGADVTTHLDSWCELAAVTRSHLTLNAGGLLVVVPPSEQISLDDTLVEKAIDTALSRMSEHNVSGKDVTKWVMRSIDEYTHGASRRANREVQCEIVAHGAELAHAFATTLDSWKGVA